MIEDMLRDARNKFGFYTFDADSLADFMKAVAAAEREACCAIVYGQCGSDNTAQRTVNAIRERGQS